MWIEPAKPAVRTMQAPVAPSPTHLHRVAPSKLRHRSAAERSAAGRRTPRTTAAVSQDAAANAAVMINSPAVAPFEFMTASRVVFGCGTSKRVPSLVKDLVQLNQCADKPALVVTGKSDRFSAPLVEALKTEGIESVVYHCPGGEPTTATAEAAIALASSNDCGSVIAIGGGTPVDTGKCVAAVLTNGGETPDLYDFLEVVGRAKPLTTRCAPFIAVPTTAGPGAEVTKNSVLEAGDRKVSMRHQFMLPELVVIDPELTLSMPADVTAHTGLDALTQCVEPYVCNATNPLVDAISLAGITAGARSLRAACENPLDVVAREDMCLCSYYGGLSLANAKLGAVHGFSGTLGGLLHAPHGAICAALLPHCCTVNVAALKGWFGEKEPELAERYLARYETVARTVTGDPNATVEDGVAWIVNLVKDCGVPGLGEFGLKEDDFDEVVAKSKESSSMKGNPVPLSDEELKTMLRMAL